LKVAPVEPPSLSLTIGFKFDSAELSVQSATQLKELNAAIGSVELAQLEFRIEGHTDGKGAPSYNLRLSERRVATVKNFLVTAGISVERLKAEGKGDTELAFPSSPFAAENRRVKIVTLNQ
jgi:outer membrane protein OmpA-like peptidoglycan-associated protein